MIKGLIPALILGLIVIVGAISLHMRVCSILFGCIQL